MIAEIVDGRLSVSFEHKPITQEDEQRLGLLYNAWKGVVAKDTRDPHEQLAEAVKKLRV